MPWLFSPVWYFIRQSSLVTGGIEMMQTFRLFFSFSLIFTLMCGGPAHARIDIFQTLPHPHFAISGIQGQDEFQRIDQNRFKFSILVSPAGKKNIHYTITTYQGDRQWQQKSVPSSPNGA
jgi:hypothetical protein